MGGTGSHWWDRTRDCLMLTDQLDDIYTLMNSVLVSDAGLSRSQGQGEPQHFSGARGMQLEISKTVK